MYIPRWLNSLQVYTYSGQLTYDFGVNKVMSAVIQDVVNKDVCLQSVADPEIGQSPG